MKTHYLVIVFLVGALILSACNLSGGGSSTPTQQALDPNAVSTAIAQTMQASQVLTMSAQLTAGLPTNTPAPTSVSTLTSIPNAAPPAAANSNSACTDSARLESENPQDGATYKPKENFRKTWTLANTGTCTWDSSYQFLFVSGEQMAAATTTKPLVSNTVVPGGLLPVFIDMQAPGKAGEYSEKWSWINGTGKTVPVSFAGGTSQVVTVKIKTQDAVAAAPTAVPTATPVPAPSVYKPSADCASMKDYLINAFQAVAWTVESPVPFNDGSACHIFGMGTGEDFWGQLQWNIIDSISQFPGYTGDSQYAGNGLGFRKGNSVADVLVFTNFVCPDPSMEPLDCEETLPALERGYIVDIYMATK